MERKYIPTRSITDGPVQFPDADSVSNHERMVEGLDEGNRRDYLRGMPEHALRNLVARSRLKSAGTYRVPEVNSISREVTFDTVSLRAQLRNVISLMYPKIKRDSAEFNRILVEALRAAEENNVPNY
jgi:hypothetical protein